MNELFKEIINYKNELEIIEELRDAVEYGSDEHDELTDKRISLYGKISALADIIKIHCDAAEKVYQDISIPQRVAKGGKFYHINNL